MKIGLASANSDYGIRPDILARDIEDRGYESLWIGEHSHIPASRQTPHPSGHELPELYWHMMDPFVSLAMAAASTDHLKLATGVCLVLEHEILDLAKSVATLDRLSEGRLLFGVGVGWNREELANVSSVPWSKRYRAMRETITALRALWSDDEAPEFHGEFVNFEAAWSHPKPTQRPGPPVLMGCQGRVGLAHVSEYADAWCPLDVGFRDVEQGIGWFRDSVSAAGRDPAEVEITMYVFGRPDTATVHRYRQLGVQRVVFSGPDRPEPLEAYLDRYQPLVDELATA